MATKKTGSLKGVDVVLVTSVNLAASDVTGVLPVANGGNGTGSFTDGQILIGQTAGNTLAKAAMSGGATMTAAGVVSVVTNANLTGPITSLGNATSIASQTGTGTKFVVDTSPTLVTPVLGVASATSLACPTFTTSSGNMTIAPAGVLGLGGAGSSQAVVSIGASHTLTGAVQVGTLLSLTGTAAGTTAIRGFQTSILTTAAAYTCSDLWHYYAPSTTLGVGSTITRSGKFVGYRDSNATYNVGLYYGTSLTWAGNYGVYIDATVDNYFGGNVGVGTASPSARVHAISTTEQLRLGYDASNYLSTTVSSAGAVNFAAVGASAAFAFNAPVSVSDGFIAGNIILYSSTVSVPTATNVTINVRASTSTMATGYCYRVRLNTAGTGTVTGAVYIINQTAATPTWVATAVSVAGSTSNHPLLLVSGSSIQVYHNHGSTYLVSYVVETIQHNNGTVNAATIWGADSLFTGTDSTSITTASGYALGVGTLPSAKIHAVSTTEQLRLGYDSSNYYSTTVSSGGAVTFDAVGASAGFTFSDAVTARSSLTLGVSSTTTGALVLCGSGGANTHTITAAAIPAATNSYVWPSASPTASQVLTASAPATGVVTLSWATNGVGDVVGPASSVTGAASVFSGTTGKLLRASPTVTYYSVAAGAEDKIEFGATFKDFRTATDGATVTFDLDLSDQWQVTFAGNRTLAVSNASIGQVITILRYQDATGSRTPTWWANIAWDNGLAPVDVPTASGWSMTVLACVGLDAYSVPNWKEVCRSTSAPLTGITTATDGATVTFDLRVSPRQKVTLAGNRTLALTSGSYYVGQTFDIKLTQDATGSRTVTWWSAIKWTGGTIPTLTTTAGKSDWFRFICTDASGSPKFDILGTSMNLGA